MARYEENKSGFQKLALSRKLRQHMVNVVGEFWANELRQYRPPGGSGEYADSITVDGVVEAIGSPPLERVGVQITAHVEYASVLEHGNDHVKNPPRPLGHLLDRIRAADPNHKAR